MKRFLFIVLFIFFLTGCSSSHNVVIQFEANGGSLVQTSQTINSESLQWVPPNPQKTGFSFVNWYLDNDFTQLYTPEALENKTLTLYAKYIEVDQENYFIIEFQSSGGTFIPNQLVAKNELLIQPTAPIKTGYTFLYWQYVVSPSDKQGVVNFTEPVLEHMVLEAVYSQESQSKR